eukprot:TRINITY_DN105019_c0_g1_i1.p1 TRINITY_DN105019_c0_g1~~TRINITY_DN105019_c0_g1_i1.p1  ORF type:complete len:260 (+),score=49.28 TRINITY_DN105019_c0_g1_i1:72-782(+)
MALKQEAEQLPTRCSRASTSATQSSSSTCRQASCSSQGSLEEEDDRDSLADEAQRDRFVSFFEPLDKVQMLEQVFNFFPHIAITLQTASWHWKPPITAMVSQGFERLSGYSSFELIGKPQRMLYHRGLEEFSSDYQVQRTVMSGKPSTFLEVFTNREGVKVATQRHCRCLNPSPRADRSQDTSFLLNVYLDLQPGESETFEDLEMRARDADLIEFLGTELCSMILASFSVQLQEVE